MLAVNAAVEAAHVGAASAGFESNTNEIRGLAQRVKGAAERTRTLPRAAHGASYGGRVDAKELEVDFTEIVDGVSRITDSIETIADATRRQQESTRAMAEAMRSIQEVTDNNARSANDSSKAATGLTEETSALARLVGQFKLDMSQANRQPDPLNSNLLASRGFRDSTDSFELETA